MDVAGGAQGTPYLPERPEFPGWTGEGLWLDGPSAAAVRAFAADAAKAEPEITTMVTHLVSRRTEASLDGLDGRLKTVDSMSRKVATEILKGTSAADSLSAVNDAVRYTVVIPDESYTRTTSELLADLKEAGFHHVGTKNSWGKTGYQGINSTFQTRDGTLFEVQFHSPASRAAGKRTHKLYEKVRNPTLPLRARRRAEGKRNRIYAAVRMPPTASTISGPRRTLSHGPMSPRVDSAQHRRSSAKPSRSKVNESESGK